MVIEQRRLTVLLEEANVHFLYMVLKNITRAGVLSQAFLLRVNSQEFTGTWDLQNFAFSYVVHAYFLIFPSFHLNL